AGIDGGLYIYDVSNPYNPQLIYLSENGGYDGVAILEEESLLVTFTWGGGDSWKISNPSNPIRVGKGGIGDVGVFLKPGYFYGTTCHFNEGCLFIRSYRWVNVEESYKKDVSVSFLDAEVFKDKIKIVYSLPEKKMVELRMMDESGRVVDILKKGISKKEEIILPLKYPSGSYFIELIYENNSLSKKINILK
ncbi:MAG: T9SS type A sorting domain-containing protein, partial [Candidatus Hydrothermales bacterium]